MSARWPWWRRLLAVRWLILVVGAVAALLLFAAVGDEILEPGSNGLDTAVRSWVLAHRAPAAVSVASAVTAVGSAWVAVMLGIAAALWLRLRHHRTIAAVVVAAPVVAAGGFVAIKTLVGRARPAGAHLAHIGTYSFPSGHATTTAAIALTLAYVAWRERVLPLTVALVLGFGWPLVVGLTRVYLDVHWMTDVLGGWCLGAAVAALAGALYERTRREQPAGAPEASSPRHVPRIG